MKEAGQITPADSHEPHNQKPQASLPRCGRVRRSPINNMSISPWETFAKQDSPNGQYVAVFDDAMEIAMGAPMRGTLTVRQKGQNNSLIELPDANGSFVWSSDSTAIAFPRWTVKRDQRLCVLRLPSRLTEEIAGRFDVLQLESLCDGLLVGIDSPIYRPKKIEIQIPQPTRR